MTFGDRVRALRSSRAWSIGRLSQVCGLSGAYLSQLESGRRRNPGLEALRALSAAFGLSLDELAGPAALPMALSGLPPAVETRIRDLEAGLGELAQEVSEALAEGALPELESARPSPTHAQSVRAGNRKAR